MMGRVYEPGAEVPMGAVPPHALSNLLKLRRLHEVADTMSAAKHVAAEPAAESVARKRGRPKGSRNKAALVAAEA